MWQCALTLTRVGVDANASSGDRLLLSKDSRLSSQKSGDHSLVQIIMGYMGKELLAPWAHPTV